MTSAGPEWVALDWTPEGINSWAIGRSGSVIMRARSPRKLSSIAPDDIESALLDFLAPWLTNGPVPIIASGLFGGPLEGRDCPMMHLPCDLSDSLPVPVRTTDPRLQLSVLPRIRQSDPVAATDGEEGVLRGVFADLPDFDGMICSPGPESRWAEISGRKLVGLSGFVTGTIREHLSSLANLTDLTDGSADSAFDHDAFWTAVHRGMTFPEGLTHDLSRLLSEFRFGMIEAVTAQARLTGKLIGAELAAVRNTWVGRQVMVIGSGLAATLYTSALETQGVPVISRSREDLALSGLKHAYGSLCETSDVELRRPG